MKDFLHILFLAIVICCWSCSGGEDVPSPTPTPTPETNKIEIRSSAPVVEQKGGTATISFTTNAAWTATIGSSTSWATVSPTSGTAGTHTLTVSTKENDTYDERNATLTIKAGNASKNITITQKQKDALTVTSNKVEIGADGGEFAIEAKANVSITYEIEETAKEWITANESRGLTAKTLKFTSKANEKKEHRQGNIILKGGDGLTETVTIYQEGEKPTLVITSEDIIVGSDGDSIKIELKSNVDYTMTLPKVDWISKEESRAISAYTHYLSIAPNETYDQRSAVVYFRSKEEDLQDSISITQLQKDAIIVAKNAYEVAPNGGKLEFTVNTNVDFEVSTSVDWIKQNAESRGLVEKTLSFTIEENDSKESREGEIIIIFDNLKQTIKIVQTSHEAIERAALIEFYKATNGENWKNNTNWCSDKPLNEWYGISANLGQVARIRLSNNQLSGSIPESLGNLSIVDLDLSNNQLSGNIPESIGNLSEIRYILLSNNQLSGNIPKSIGNLSELKNISFDHNRLSGNIPESIGYLSKLFNLTLNNNQLSGNIPEFLGNMSGLNSLFLENNLLSGNIPEFLGKMQELKNLSLENNQLSGPIPESFMRTKVWARNWYRILRQKGTGFSKEDFVIPAPKFKEKTIDGNTLDDSIYSKNKYTIFYHFFNWCGISSDYTPKLMKLYEKYRDKGVEVIAFSREAETADYYYEYAQRFNTQWPYIFGDCSEAFYAYSWVSPCVNVVDKNGYVVFNWILDNYNLLGAFLAENLEEQEEDYTSTDYSRDGEVVTLQTATEGQGINLTFIGEAFVDKDMEKDGLYEQKMKEGMEKFFSIEPYKSLRNRFNVYAVKVISPNAEFTEDAKHRINLSNEVCFEYARKIPNADKNPSMVSVIYNTTYTVDRSYTTMYSDGSFVGYMMDGISNVLIHEAGGHGFANLLDEYVEPGLESSTLTQDEATLLDNLWKEYTWGANVDWRSDASTVKWSHFLNDSRYANEGLGLYEGAYLYGYGAYRPTENSMMRHNDSPFNAPSREQIYKRIMQLSEGDDWKYDYEEFVKFDEKSRNAESRSAIKPLSEAEKREYIKNHRPPTFIKGTWRDVMKNGPSKIIVPLR